MYTLKQKTPPVNLAVDLERVKRYLRLTSSTHDPDLTELYIPAATQHCEIESHRQFITSTWQLGLSCFPADRLYLPWGQLQSVSSISYVDSDGATQTWDPSNYTVNTDHEPGYVVPNDIWPTGVSMVGDHPVTIEYICGYGDASDSVPAAARSAILMQVAHLFDQRASVVTGTIATKLPRTVEHVLLQVKLADDFWDYGLEVTR